MLVIARVWQMPSNYAGIDARARYQLVTPPPPAGEPGISTGCSRGCYEGSNKLEVFGPYLVAPIGLILVYQVLVILEVALDPAPARVHACNHLADLQRYGFRSVVGDAPIIVSNRMLA